MISLRQLLSIQLLRWWPRRSQQELLLGLGERKSWKDADREQALEQLSVWMQQELGLPGELDWRPPPVEVVREDLWGGLHSLGLPLDRTTPGVSGYLAALARLTGASSAKALSNSLVGGLRPDRLDHRWLFFLSQLDQGPLQADALLYHRRKRAAVAGVLQAAGADVQAALLLYSLVALQQRRRTVEKGALPRRLLPKPVSALSQTLLRPGQLKPLLELARRKGRGDLAALVLECALTEAHILPHPPRRSRRGSSATEGSTLPHPLPDGELWLSAVEKELPSLTQLLGQEAPFFSFRVGWMRAWRERKPLPLAPPEIHSDPYIHALRQLQQQKNGEEAEVVDGEASGTFMLLPLLRKKGLLR